MQQLISSSIFFKSIHKARNKLCGFLGLGVIVQQLIQVTQTDRGSWAYIKSFTKAAQATQLKKKMGEKSIN